LSGLAGDESWVVEKRTGTAADLHRPWPDEVRRSRRVMAICAPLAPVTLVLGSAQREVVPGLEDVVVVHRSSGGGAVLIAPRSQVWIEVWLPRTDPLWDDDVLRSSWWLGEAWRDALADLGVSDLDVHEGRLARTAWSDLICFAGVGPGELRWRERKLVGISQRRDRHGARFQSVSPLRPLAGSLLGAVGVDPLEREKMETTLARGTACLLEATGLTEAEGDGLLGRVEELLARSIAAVDL
jgi:lipoate-protein ligase A